MGNDSVANAMGMGPVITIEANGKEYTLAPLLMEEMGEVELFAKARHRKEIRAFIEEMGDLLDTKERVEMIKELRDEVSGVIRADPDDPDAPRGWTWLSEMTSPAVISLVIKLRLKKANPELSDEEATNIITLEAIAAVEAEMSDLLGLDAFTTAMVGDEEAPGEAKSG